MSNFVSIPSTPSTVIVGASATFPRPSSPSQVLGGSVPGEYKRYYCKWHFRGSGCGSWVWVAKTACAGCAVSFVLFVPLFSLQPLGGVFKAESTNQDS